MEKYIQAFENSNVDLLKNCDLTNLYGRIKVGRNPNDFSRLTMDPTIRVTWVFDHQTLRKFIGMSHLDMVIHTGTPMDSIRHKLETNVKFKLIICTLSSDDVVLATWENIFDLLPRVYPEIDSNIWKSYGNQLKQMTLSDIDPQGSIVKNYRLGENVDGFMTLNRFLNLSSSPTLLDVRAFLYHHLRLNELFQGNGRTLTCDGTLVENEYLVINRNLNEFSSYALLDLHPILP